MKLYDLCSVLFVSWTQMDLSRPVDMETMTRLLKPFCTPGSYH